VTEGGLVRQVELRLDLPTGATEREVDLGRQTLATVPGSTRPVAED
jgi:hypothetical protein